MCCAGAYEKKIFFGLLVAVARHPSLAWHQSVEHQFDFPIRWAAPAQDCGQKQQNEREKICIIEGVRDALGELGNQLDFSERIHQLSQEASVGATPRVKLCCYTLERAGLTLRIEHIYPRLVR